MRRLLLVLMVGSSVGLWAQNAPSSSPGNSQAPDSASPASQPASKPAKARTPNMAPPRSDSVNADALGDTPGESSSKDTQIDLSPPADDVKAHPNSSDVLVDEGSGSGSGDGSAFRYWDPHKAAKSVEVGDYYFKRKNYVAAESRYREALTYKNNDALATFRLAVCLEKLERPEDARKEYESYMAILPHGPQAEESQKAIERLKGTAASAKTAK